MAEACLSAFASQIMPTTTASKPPITCHVLDTVIGRPASSITCTLFQLPSGSSSVQPTQLARGTTNSDGRVTAWDSDFKLENDGQYKIRFEVGDYFLSKNEKSFFPYVEIAFVVADIREHYHVPLLLAPWSYSTYRGS